MKPFYVKSRLGTLLTILIICGQLKSQVLPKEGSKLNYRIIGFLFGGGKQTGKYTLEIARGNDATESDFNKNVILTLEADEPKVIAEVPFFGCVYTWRTIFTGKGAKIIKSPLHHFSTGYCLQTDTSKYRLRVTVPAAKYKDDYVFLDGSRALYDMEGQPVWYLPDSIFNTLPIDLKLSPQGTVTFILNNEDAYEVNYQGDILWKAPNDGRVSGEGAEHYHHEFTRLANGHYMALGIGHVYVLKNRSALGIKQAVTPDSIVRKAAGNDTGYMNTQYETIIEYDKAGKVLWSWKLLDYLASSDLRYFVKQDNSPYFDMRENAFFFDEQNKCVYVSLKTCSRILKIQYPGGKVVNAYGEVFKPGVPEMKNGPFYGQHACKISKDGYLYLFNNNMRDSTCLPEVQIMQEPIAGVDTLKKIWQFNCTPEGDKLKRETRTLQTGGNVAELPDGSMFVSMPGNGSPIFIVDMDKEILWSGITENWEPREKKWMQVSQYRASIISRKELECLIWNLQGTEVH